ncbi:hypothetical protein CARUB_v10011296mg [Capsella rubella]|uniref:F-box domain-containing protein n=1 Tax=Capsella rubella TaxID=81985 RepID=R0GN95_9BRAS|nr:hypothetical protein CARUB_v10011296mg [Capsella rubella]
MNDLPLFVLDDVLFRLELKSLAMMRCTNKFFQSYISNDSDFQIAYFAMYKIEPIMFHLDSCEKIELDIRNRLYIFGSCSGLLLLYINGLFVANPLTKTYRILDHSGSKLIPRIVDGLNLSDPFLHMERAMCVGFAVNRNQTTKRFKIVGILEMETVYGFEINDGDSWRLSETSITTSTKSDLTTNMKHVYLDGTLHWLRNDGSIIAFDSETEQARLIPSIFHRKQDMKLLFATDDKISRLTLISGTEETISVYTLVENSKWTLSRQINIVSMEGNIIVRLSPETQKLGGDWEDLFRIHWNMVAYDGKFLVVREMRRITSRGLVHLYDMEANSWRILGSIWCGYGDIRNFYKFTPSLLSVEKDEQTKVLIASDDQRIPYLTEVMGLIDTTMGSGIGPNVVSNIVTIY